MPTFDVQRSTFGGRRSAFGGRRFAFPPYDYSPGYAVQKLTFQLNGDYVELNQLLKLVGICDSGGAGKMLVASGAVSVDGQQELRKTCKIHQGQVVRVGDITISVSSKP